MLPPERPKYTWERELPPNYARLARIGRMRTGFLRRTFAEPLLKWLDEQTPKRREFRTSFWFWSKPYADPTMIHVTPHSWISVNVTLLTPDGRLIMVQDLRLRTGRGWDREAFERRLAAELKRLESEGDIGPVPHPSALVRSSVVLLSAYRVQRRARARRK